MKQKTRSGRGTGEVRVCYIRSIEVSKQEAQGDWHGPGGFNSNCNMQ